MGRGAGRAAAAAGVTGTSEGRAREGAWGCGACGPDATRWCEATGHDRLCCYLWALVIR